MSYDRPPPPSPCVPCTVYVLDKHLVEEWRSQTNKQKCKIPLILFIHPMNSCVSPLVLSAGVSVSSCDIERCLLCRNAIPIEIGPIETFPLPKPCNSIHCACMVDTRLPWWKLVENERSHVAIRLITKFGCRNYRFGGTKCQFMGQKSNVDSVRWLVFVSEIDEMTQKQDPPRTESRAICALGERRARRATDY